MMAGWLLLALAALLRLLPAAGAAARPSFIVLMTDDQDLLLGSLHAMPKVPYQN